jgi:hypothetical protein
MGKNVVNDANVVARLSSPYLAPTALAIRQVGGLFALDPRNIMADLAIEIKLVGPVAHQSAALADRPVSRSHGASIPIAATRTRCSLNGWRHPSYGVGSPRAESGV